VPALDGVRGLAALLVMIFHFGRAEVPGRGAAAVGFFAQFGWGGVDLFFVLSGFLICGILLDTRDRPGFLRTFYTRRALRIFPLYFAFLAAYIFVIAPRLPGASDIEVRQRWLWLYVSNFDVAAHGWYSGGGSHANHLWSLAIEEQFYLLAPFAVLALSRRRGRDRSARRVGACRVPRARGLHAHVRADRRAELRCASRCARAR
jgi:peptidoglycan/LPS O-acetylase OafA/YrhL